MTLWRWFTLNWPENRKTRMPVTSSMQPSLDSHHHSCNNHRNESSPEEDDDERNFPQDLTTTTSFDGKNSTDGQCLDKEEQSCISRCHSPMTSNFSDKSNEKIGECAGCGLGITDRYYLFAVDQHWHVSCLKCDSCQVSLDSEVSCFTREGKIFCKADYYRYVDLNPTDWVMFIHYRHFAVKRCTRCGQGIYATDVVMKIRDGNVYHLSCFTCCWCNIPLSQGDYFGMNGNLVYCRAHFIMRVFEMTNHPSHIYSSRPHPAALTFRSQDHSLKTSFVSTSESAIHPEHQSHYDHSPMTSTLDSYQNQLHHRRQECESPSEEHRHVFSGPSSGCLMPPPLLGMAGVTQTLAHDVTLLSQASITASEDLQREDSATVNRNRPVLTASSSPTSPTNVSTNRSSHITDLSEEGKLTKVSSAVKSAGGSSTTRKGRPRKRKLPPSAPNLPDIERADVLMMDSSSREQHLSSHHLLHHQENSGVTGGLSGQTPPNLSCEYILFHFSEQSMKHNLIWRIRVWIIIQCTRRTTTDL